MSKEYTKDSPEVVKLLEVYAERVEEFEAQDIGYSEGELYFFEGCLAKDKELGEVFLYVSKNHEEWLQEITNTIITEDSIFRDEITSFYVEAKTANGADSAHLETLAQFGEDYENLLRDYPSFHKTCRTIY